MLEERDTIPSHPLLPFFVRVWIWWAACWTRQNLTWPEPRRVVGSFQKKQKQNQNQKKKKKKIQTKKKKKKMWKKIWKKNLHCLLLSARNSAPSQITTKPLQTRRPIPCQKTKFLINPRSNNTRRISTSLSNEYLNPGFIRTPQCNRRLYYTDQRGYEHFRRRGFGPHHVKDNTDKYRVYAFVAISVGGISALVYSANQEIIPYTYRKHFVLISPKFESQLVDMQFEAVSPVFKS